MYRVLLVDDEPLILAGIKSMIDWRLLQCELVGTARNGKQAADRLDDLRPDIVIADINMPVMNGLELLRYAREHYPRAVFIMLTNLQEFELVRESMRLGANDYLVKAELDEQSLRRSLNQACQKVRERKYLSEADAARLDRDEQRRERLCHAARRLIKNGALTDAQRDILREYGVWEGYYAAELRLTPDEDQEERRRLLRWVSEMAENLAKTHFKWNIPVETDEGRIQLLYGKKTDDGSMFAQKLTDISQDVIGVKPFILLCGFFTGEESAEEPRARLTALRAYQYLSGTRVLSFDSLPATEYRPLGLAGISARLTAELNSRRAQACDALMEHVLDKLKSTPHSRAEMLWLFGELYDAAQKSLCDLPGEHYFRDAAGREEIERLTTLDSALHWLERLKNEISCLLEPKASTYTVFLEKARQYVYDNIDKRILLRDAAHFAYISPAYLSVLFKREYNQSFIDFVNQTKIERACELMIKGDFRIGEISYMLGFENAYYFSRVFRRHMSMSPSEFLQKHKHNTAPS